MGHFSVPLEVFSSDGTRSVTIDAMVDTGASYTCLPKALLQDLGIVPSRKVESKLADGTLVEDDVAIARMNIQNVEVAAYVVFVEEPAPTLLGVIALESALLAVDPIEHRLIPTSNLRVSRL